MLNIRTATTRRYISVHDDAVVHDGDGKQPWEDFMAGECGIEKLVIRDGCKPTVFSLRRLTRAQSEHVNVQEHVSVGWREAVAYGLVGWENYPGDPVRLEEPSDLGPRLTKACMDSIYTPELFRELGSTIYGMSMLGPTKELG